MIATCSGQRKFVLPNDDSSSDEEDEVEIDNTLKTWRVPGQYQWFSYQADPYVGDTSTTAVDNVTIDTNNEVTADDMIVENTTIIEQVVVLET